MRETILLGPLEVGEMAIRVDEVGVRFAMVPLNLRDDRKVIAFHID
jgi:hypothetical protein